MLAAGVDLKVVPETLGHVSSTFTRDTYTSVYPEVTRAAAESTTALVDPAAASAQTARLITAHPHLRHHHLNRRAQAGPPTLRRACLVPSRAIAQVTQG
ncbi:Integrase [[Actinomadura] parvosata subsp. kistnae]|uniref:Tyr recombinase domain-containing protein n=1 Tax=[Actinomadura] parvosata subsp. kistnae TaxID=1909395 RepID=A0A1U9ZX92_9ACTN|nr:hypothetical protein BKM31_14795 [Nonomuraea sp. ATCC 55076]SPL88829.1 Integrase [Actinomadura parvosata subsp. kistnae]